MFSQAARIITPRSHAANTLAKLEDALSNPPCLSCSHLEMKYKAVDSMLGRKIIEVMDKDLEIRRITAEAQKRKVALDVRYNDYVNATRTSLDLHGLVAAATTSISNGASAEKETLHELLRMNIAAVNSAGTKEGTVHNFCREQLGVSTGESGNAHRATGETLLYETTHTHAVEPNSVYLRHKLAKSDKQVDQQQRTTFFNKWDKPNTLAFESVHCILNIADRHVDQMVDAHSGWARSHTEILEQLSKDLLEACELWLDDGFDLGIEEFKENMAKLAELMAPRGECAAKKMAKANAAMRDNLGKLRNQLITGINVTNTCLGPTSVRSWYTNNNTNASASANANASRLDQKGKVVFGSYPSVW
ncbi:hypothetical protein BX661DRAFT_170318 [Kickxella alabastrina]|uniref:uncharacterized protein n=1 Tax=Kickxella alabastrina TaxID=61397 RepID=UPI00221ED913|nr:uncharacterized protein BX661DRAFT_170318 [Kickxella alabastrina]KAI7829956.1 hypothetical protein BX661DRAFT_170318 [Kickxella alabastrina]